MHVGNVSHFALKQSSSDNGRAFCLDRDVLYVIHEFRAKAVRTGAKIRITFLTRYRRHIRLAKACGGLDKGVEHGLQVKRRAADDLEHVGGRGLLLERFREIARLGLYLFEQSRVFDGDDGLVGKGF